MCHLGFKLSSHLSVLLKAHVTFKLTTDASGRSINQYFNLLSKYFSCNLNIDIPCPSPLQYCHPSQAAPSTKRNSIAAGTQSRALFDCIDVADKGEASPSQPPEKFAGHTPVSPFMDA